MGNIVLIGAGGTGMSGLAMLLQQLGYTNLIAINDVENQLTQRLHDRNIKVIIGHGLYQVKLDDFVIYSDIPAIVAGPEVSQSRLYQQTPTQKHFHICISYNQMIAEISKHFMTIAVTGSNGKSSTTGMLIHTLYQNDKSFGLGIVGALMPQYDNQGYLINTTIMGDIRHLFEHIFNQKHQLDYDLLKKYLFVIEACEYKNHFLSYDIDYSLITNIQHDHIDFFPTAESYNDAFRHLIGQTKKKVILTPSATETLTQGGLNPFTSEKCMISESYPFDSDYLIGSHHHSNAGMVITLLQEMQNLKPTIQNIDSILGGWKGLGRRMELITTTPSGTKVYSDYSHHAPAVLGNLQALKKQFPDRHIITIFQPHQAQRVLAGRDDFSEALLLSDETVIYKLYTAREDFDELKKIYPQLADRQSFDELGEKFAEHVHGTYITIVNDIVTTIQRDYHAPTIIVIFSAGDLDYQVRRSIR